MHIPSILFVTLLKETIGVNAIVSNQHIHKVKMDCTTRRKINYGEIENIYIIYFLVPICNLCNLRYLNG